jgi:hypothetical protein
MNDERYLWDRGGTADPEVVKLESLLGRFRGEPRPLQLPGPPARARRLRMVAVAAVLVAAAGSLWVLRSGAGRQWRVETLDGVPLVGSRPLSGASPLPVGQGVETDAFSRAKVRIGRIAEISLDPGSRLRLVKAGPVEQRLALDRGRISAKISAPPRLFLVETPSALAVDLGCEYTLEVDASGAGLLRVETGWVSFERGGKESVVPAGAVCATRPREGPGTPYYEDAAPELRRALELYDFDGGGERALLEILDSRADGDTRERVYERLARLVPPPAGLTKEGALRGDRRMLELWRWELEGMPLLPRESTFWSFCRKLWFRLAT